MPTYELKRRRLHRRRWVLDWQRRIPKHEEKLLYFRYTDELSISETPYNSWTSETININLLDGVIKCLYQPIHLHYVLY